MSIKALASFVRGKMYARGWSQTDLAAEAGIPKGTISNIMNAKVTLPDLGTFLKLSRALEVPLRTLLEITGVNVESPAGEAEKDRQITAYLEASPWLQPVLEALVNLSPEDQASILAYLDALQQRRGESRSTQ